MTHILDQKPTYYTNAASYLESIWTKPDELVQRFQSKMEINNVEYDTLIGRGVSGALAVPLFARAAHTQYGIVRKDEGSHSSRTVEGTIGKRWIFVDDLIDSGETFLETAKKMASFSKNVDWSTQLVGAYLYLSNNLVLGNSAIEILGRHNSGLHV